MSALDLATLPRSGLRSLLASMTAERGPFAPDDARALLRASRSWATLIA
jgi:hypothetical protein